MPAAPRSHAVVQPARLAEGRRWVRGVAVRGRGPLILSSVAIAVTVALLPVSGRYLGPTTAGFVSAVVAVVGCFDLLSMWLLAGEYRDTGDRRMLAMAVAYLWSLILVGGYAFAFPGVVSAHPRLAVTPSVAPYLYLGWHLGFPVLLGAAWMPWAALDHNDEPNRRARTIGITILGTSVLGVGTMLVLVGEIHRLPVIIHGLNTTAMTELTAPFALPLILLSLVVCVRGLRGRTGPERWTQLAIVVCTCDLVLTYLSRYRYSLGWYAGRSLTVIGTATVLVAMLASFRTLKARAEFHAAYDALTGLSNRRSTYDALSTLIARALRGRTHLTVVMFDLDHFKEINDTHGHAAGDIVLRAVAESLRATVREGDVIGRIGGEEFLILLPDAGEGDARVVVERLRASLRLSATRYCRSGVTASFGIAALDSDHATADALTHRADLAMYRAKAAGRDRVALTTELPG